MKPKKHWAIGINNTSNKVGFIDQLINGPLSKEFHSLRGLQGALFSKLELDRFMDEEERHGAKTISMDTPQSLKSMSSGEQKKALLKFILAASPDFIILDNPFDNLDVESQAQLTQSLQNISEHTQLVQIVSRKRDLLPFMTHFFSLEHETLRTHGSISELDNFFNVPVNQIFQEHIPKALHPTSFDNEVLIDL